VAIWKAWEYLKAREYWDALVLLRRGKVSGSCEHGNETSGCINCGKSFYLPENYWLYEKESGP